jgi:hypothetical protein
MYLYSTFTFNQRVVFSFLSRFETVLYAFSRECVEESFFAINGFVLGIYSIQSRSIIRGCRALTRFSRDAAKKQGNCHQTPSAYSHLMFNDDIFRHCRYALQASFRVAALLEREKW